jgi:hypothetical protein
MANMTDQARVNAILQIIFLTSTTVTLTGGTGGGTIVTTPPYKLRLMQTMGGSNVTNNTEQTGTNGYTTGGNSMGATAFGTPAAGVILNANAVTWTASGAWPAVLGIEVWDSAGTPLRWLQGAITSVTLANGNTLTFAVGSISASAAAW